METTLEFFRSGGVDVSAAGRRRWPDDLRARIVAEMHIGRHAAKPYTAKSIFNISAMSYGAIPRPAIKALSRGAAKAEIRLNTGEGGLAPHHLTGGCDIVFQIATAKYSLRDAHGNLSDERLRAIGEHPEVVMFEVKLAQGAKPGTLVRQKPQLANRRIRLAQPRTRNQRP